MSNLIIEKIVSGKLPGFRGSQGIPGDNPLGPQGITIQGPEGEIGNPGPTCACRLDQDVQDTKATGASNQDILQYNQSKWTKATLNQININNIDFSNIPQFTTGPSNSFGLYKLYRLSGSPDILRLFVVLNPEPLSENFLNCTNPIPNGWSRDPVPASAGNFGWNCRTGIVGTNNTGPDTGKFGNSYMMLEASGGSGQTATLSLPEKVIGTQLSFWYHMYGNQMGDLHVDISTDGGNNWTLDITPTISGEQHTSGSDFFLDIPSEVLHL